MNFERRLVGAGNEGYAVGYALPSLTNLESTDALVQCFSNR